MFINMKAVRDSTGAVSEGKLADALRDLDKKGGSLPLHIRAQNAGIIISKVNQSINLEVFELAPHNEAVITTKGRLRRSFPGPALSVDMQIFEQISLQATMAHTLAKMSHQSAVGTQPKAMKAGQMHDEDRDTTHPKLVTELFMGFLRSPISVAEVAPLVAYPRRHAAGFHSLLDSVEPTQRPLQKLHGISHDPRLREITGISLEVSTSNDLLYSMNAKVVRRLVKLDSAIKRSILNFIKDVLQRSRTLLDTRWSEIMKRELLHINLLPLKDLDFEQDTFVSLPELDHYIKAATDRKSDNGSLTFQPRSALIKYEAEVLPKALALTADYTVYNLKAFEAWVASNLESWLDNHKASSSTCADLDELIRTYHSIAKSFYSGNPEGVSLMLLTIFELWSACDESAIHCCEILRDYDPGISKEPLESLVLPSKSLMERLLRLENYVKRRRECAKFPAMHIFQKFGHQNIFSSRYFAQSPDHQSLLAEIKAKAASDRQEKQDEFRSKKAQYNDLMQLYDQNNCEYYEYKDPSTEIFENRHSSTCQKCIYESEAAAMKIIVHEWPLPSDEWAERCTVFELKVLQSFGHWRETTLFVMMNVLQSAYKQKEAPRASYPLHSYAGLSAFFVPFSSTKRIGLLSQDKPHEATHRSAKYVSSSTESDVCPNNGLAYKYYDSETGLFITNLNPGNEIPRACSYKLPTLSSSLQKFLFRPASKPDGLSPNTVIAKALHEVLQRVKENWETSQVLQTLISLAHRLLSLTPTQKIRDECLAYLAEVRLITFSWVNLLQQKASKAADDNQRVDLSAKAAEIALTCVDSFNLDERYLYSVLSMSKYATILLQCSIVIQEGNLTVSKSTEPVTSLLYQRWRALSYSCHTLLSEEILERNNQCLDDAIKGSWSAYQAGHGWQVASDQARHWLITQIAPDGESDPISVHFNMLDSDLLVNEVPLARLPAQYETHPYYSTFFGKSTIEIMPTAVSGCNSLQSRSMLATRFMLAWITILATKSGCKYELIPSRLFRGNFPTAFVENFAHWYDLSTSSIEFRPIKDPWTSSPTNWRATHQTRAGLESKLHLTKDGKSLVGVKSETAEMISRILSPLEDPLRIHGIFNHRSVSLDIGLPNLQLGFYLKSQASSIQSRQFRGMSIDPDQSLGTLIGLSNKLILKDERQGNRRIIVPEGSVSHHISNGHIRVIIDKTSASKALVYEVNSRLDLKDSDQYLLERDCIRSSTFRVSGFGAEDHTIEHDAVYKARHGSQFSVQGSRAFLISSFIYRDGVALPLAISSSSSLNTKLYTFLSQTLKILGPSSPLEPSELKYDSKLLLDGCTFFSTYWTVLHQNLGQGQSWIDKFRLMIWLSILAFSEKTSMEIIQVLASFFKVPAMVQIPIPRMESIQLEHGAKATKPALEKLIDGAVLPFDSCPEGQLPSLLNKKRALTDLASALHPQFPCEIPATPDCGAPGNFSKKISDTLVGQAFSPIGTPSSSFSVPEWNLQKRHGFVSFDEILGCTVPPVLPPAPTDLTDLWSRASPADTEILRLGGLIDHLDVRAKSKYERDYIKDLQESMSFLWEREETHHLKPGQDVEDVLFHHLDSCNKRCNGIYSAIVSRLIASANDASEMASIVRQWPRLSPTLLLQQLSRSRWSKIQSWQYCIVQYGLALTELQRAERLFSSVGNHTELIKELKNPGHTNWSPFEFPEALLLEVESGILIREVQEQIARQMRDPPSNTNVVMQLNMGEGKSSVIIPIVAVALANGSRLVRVIVAKPQSKQMLHMLLSKLGGLLDRRVYHMPFSRELKLGQTQADVIDNICRECMESGGILLIQPEHILSFKLMGLECLITGKEVVGRSLLSTQDFFDTSSRDLVDESDENFSVKFELIYTMGIQRPIELSPDRWICIHHVLGLVRKFVPLVKTNFPDSLDVYEGGPGAFPRTRILRPIAGEKILSHIAKHICKAGMNGFPIARQPEPVRQAVFRYITERNLTAEEIAQVENEGGFWADTTSNTLLLLRGLLAGGVLAFAFGQKRWRVNYGLDSTRLPGTKLAVPHRAKDSPAPHSEFSHPDVVIVLTSLSYYYGGLKNNEPFLALGHLLKADQAGDEYQEWVKDAPGLPIAFQHVSGITLKDEVQCKDQVFPSLRFAKAAVDYFLAHIVFPKEMKEFPHKLSASGWGIGQLKALPTTGFSGTNDSRKVLPLSVGHLDLVEQKHTNALVLEYLLQPDNSVALIPSREKTFSSDAELLMDMVTKMDREVQVILDVGAQILELSNLMVASKWLKMTQDHDKLQAAIFFDDSDELCVIDRSGRVELWQTSPFAKQPDVCLVFLDEAHTRGTDLKLPIHYLAAVTLGPSLTKDRLVQACMRMRQLGKGQSVVFCVAEEIASKILARSSKRDEATIDVSDVLEWAISETSVDIRRSLPLWATQGQRFEKQSAIWAGAEARDAGHAQISKELADEFLEDEARSLQDRYRPRPGTDVIPFGHAGQNKNLKLIIERCQEFNDLEFASSTLQEEQERELSPEIAEERQVQKPKTAEPAAHIIYDDLKAFVTQGVPVPGSKAYKPAFEALCNTSAAAYLDITQFPRDLFVTADFASTIQIAATSDILDAYQRPVQWVLTSTSRPYSGSGNIVEFMMIISPFEANVLLSLIQISESVTLHLYSPRPNMGFRALDGLDLYTVHVRPVMPTMPRNLIIQLNLFAGQLYLSSYQEYVELCQSLGLAYGKTDKGNVVAADGFIISRNGSVGPGSGCTFTDSPVKFLKVLMTNIRRNCEAIDKTHMGQILDGKILLPTDFGKWEDGI
ncbi:hypothetical protein D0Z07_4347 [Hyphodiscus hymeniophilus]|uniref:ubiquitinyl hydrolase 1 n=1 Tax=Hyphodiscus hymeniophilus TaxID=353542 RepID=A0A9P6VJW2_9HELO|nr:hypothetical protein D0Z07_4347 [Hyphodiscus hymeniophilus]